MFRYIGFSWVAANEAQGSFAGRLEQAVQARGHWQPAFRLAGQRVYTTGSISGVNDTYRLPANQGVILGRLFRRGSSAPSRRGDLEITELEAHQIVQSDGLALVERFWGRYVAFLPSWTGQARVLRDPTGTLPCYRLEIEGVCIVLSWLEDLVSLLDLTMPPVDWDAVAAHMVLGHVSGRQSLLAGVTQVLAGELTPLGPGHGTPLRLWSAADCARHPSAADPAESSRLLRDTVATCAQSWASCYESIVLRLSGGVDSAILLGNLAPAVPPGQLTCLNYHLPGTDSDERRYARLAAQRSNVALVERTLDDAFRLESVLDVARTPVPANYIGGMGTSRIDAEMANSLHAGAVFNGAGGDQLFYEVRCTWPAADYLRLRGIDRGFLAAVLDSAHLGHVSFWKALRHAISDRTLRGNPVSGSSQFLTLMQCDAKEAATETAQRFVHPDWLAAADLPIGKFQQLGMVICPFEYYNHYLREATPERVHPLMSQPLLELCMATPTYILTEGGRGRGLARSAFADHMPPEIASRRSKGGTERFIATVLQRNLAFARDMLLDGLLVKQGLLDRARVEAALAGSPAAKAAYVSEIHVCIATEAWLRRASTSTRHAMA